jgi:hypothetical protein
LLFDSAIGNVININTVKQINNVVTQIPIADPAIGLEHQRAMEETEDDPERIALSWLLDFVHAGPDELEAVCEPRGVFGEFAERNPDDPVPKSSIRRFHAEFKKLFCNVFADQGRKGEGIITLSQRPVSYVLLRNAGAAPRGFFEGCWEISFLSLTNIVLARFGQSLAQCRGCSRIFLKEHGLQAYCTRQCGERLRQKRHEDNMICKIRALRGWQKKLPSEVARDLEIPQLQARKYLALAKEHTDGGPNK